MRRMSGLIGAVLGALRNAIVYLISVQWLREVIELVLDLIAIHRRSEKLEDSRRARDPRCRPVCGKVSPDVYRRADPMIYSQRYLIEQGLAVTWNNPDIQLYENGQPVSSSQLKPNTEYEVRATIWNNSTQAPAVGLGVDFYYHDFGIGPAPINLGSDTVTLPVKGAPGHPATARATWRTPQAGHYRLLVRLNWADDANPKNNIGQENTRVGAAQSPAAFEFPVRNEADVRRTLRLVADSYEIPQRIDCRERPTKKDSDRRYPALVTRPVFVPLTEEEGDWTLARFRHGAERFPVPPGWRVEIQPTTLTLNAGETRQVQVSVTPPDDFAGEQTINVNAMRGTDLAGGVTLFVSAGA